MEHIIYTLHEDSTGTTEIGMSEIKDVKEFKDCKIFYCDSRKPPNLYKSLFMVGVSDECITLMFGDLVEMLEYSYDVRFRPFQVWKPHDKEDLKVFRPISKDEFDYADGSYVVKT